MRRPLPVLLLVPVVLLAACSGGDDGDDASAADDEATTTTGADVTIEPAPTTSTTAATGDGCPGPGAPRDEPANEGQVADLDGDGEPDTVWVASPGDGRRVLGVETSAGGGDKVDVRSASPVAVAVLVADADGVPPVELFVDDNRSTRLYAFADCRLQAVTDPDGDPYVFDRGYTGYGTGLGCVDADGDGDRDLVGLNDTGSGDAAAVPWTRTIIERDGLVAANGATDEGTYEQPGDDAAIELLHQVTCGDLSLTDDGIRQPEE